MAKRWHEHLEAYGKQAYHGMMEGPPYPKAQPNASRRDAWPPEGGPQGPRCPSCRSNCSIRTTSRSACSIRSTAGRGLRNQDLAGAICSAINDWQIEKWTARIPA